MNGKLKYNELDERLAKRIYRDLLAMNPLQTKPRFEKWADEIRLLRESKKIDHMEIFRVWEWANKDDFWKTNILSPGKLRKQFDQLLIKKNASAKPQPVRRVITPDVITDPRERAGYAEFMRTEEEMKQLATMIKLLADDKTCKPQKEGLYE